MKRQFYNDSPEIREFSNKVTDEMLKNASAEHPIRPEECKQRTAYFMDNNRVNICTETKSEYCDYRYVLEDGRLRYLGCDGDWKL